MINQILIMIIVTLSIMFIKVFMYIMHGKKCINTKAFLTEGTNDKFKEIVADIYKENGQEIENARVDTLTLGILTHILLVLGISFPIIGFIEYSDKISQNLKIVILITSIIALLLSLYSYTYEKRYYTKYNMLYKKLILNSYIRRMNRGFAYDMNSTISRETYEKLSLDEEIIDYFGQDHLTGVIEGRNINISKLYVKSLENNKKTIFCGLFGYASTDVEDEIVIQESDTLKKEETIEFFKYYNITNKTNKSNFIMPNELMDYIASFRKKYDVNVRIIIKGNKTYVKINTGDIFEPSLYRKNESINRLWTFYLMVKFIVDTTDMLKGSCDK